MPPSGETIDLTAAPVARPPYDTRLVDALCDAVVVTDADQSVVYANPATLTILGWDPASLTGHQFAELVPPRLRRAHRSTFAAALADPARFTGRPLRTVALRADGSELPVDLMMTVSGPYLVADLRDARDRANLERHTLVVDRILDVLADDTSPDAMIRSVLGRLGETLDWAVTTFWRATGAGGVRCEQVWHGSAPELADFAAVSLGRQLSYGMALPGQVIASGEPVWIADIDAGSGFTRARAAADDGLRSGFAFPIRARRATVGVIELFSTEPREADTDLIETMTAIGERVGEFLERAEVEAERSRLLAELREAQRSQQFLLDASRVLAEAEGYQATLERLSALALGRLGDICLIDLAEDGHLVRTVARHRDPAKQALTSILRRYAPDAEGDHPVAQAIRERRSQWSAEVTEDFLRNRTRGRTHADALRSLAVSSYLAVPLVARDRVLGTVTLMSTGSSPTLGEDDLARAEELAAQVAAVVDNARRFEREHEMAHLLQRRLLPQRLPAVEGLAIAVRYLPGSEGAEVGGDWYDVMELPGGLTGLVVGDVAGHDMAAASTMGQLRAGLRAFASTDLRPGEVLSRLHEFLLAADPERIATAVYGCYDPADGRLVVASAGHLPPLLIGADGGVRTARVSTGPPLGAASGYPETTLTLAPGETVLLYTDGLVERRRTSLGRGIGHVRRAIAALTPRTAPERLCSHIIDTMLPGGTDDVAVLAAMRVGGANRV